MCARRPGGSFGLVEVSKLNDPPDVCMTYTLFVLQDEETINNEKREKREQKNKTRIVKSAKRE